jgi:2-oxo-4-hydroxy-4-carboxy-5-ureidoimidazoline decarboxylase
MASSLATLNGLGRDEFRRALGGVFEQSPWVPERAFDRRPFASVGDLHAAMTQVVRQASREEQLALIRAHPDLAGRAARAGAMSPHSVAEQSVAGLDRLTDEEYARFERLNDAYRARFGFPFVIAVRRHDKGAILKAFETRLGNSVDTEVETALAQIAEIARLRLEALAGAP